jgi:heme-degrading monooxygenase HmoA
MFVVLWEFEVKPGCEEHFERVYGGNGDWATLFRRDSRYLGTSLWRDARRMNIYLTMDSWTSQGDYERFLENEKAAYHQLDACTQDLTARERHAGSYFSVGLK